MAALESVLRLMCPGRISDPREAALGWMWIDEVAWKDAVVPEVFFLCMRKREILLSVVIFHL